MDPGRGINGGPGRTCIWSTCEAYELYGLCGFYGLYDGICKAEWESMDLE